MRDSKKKMNDVQSEIDEEKKKKKKVKNTTEKEKKPSSKKKKTEDEEDIIYIHHDFETDEEKDSEAEEEKKRKRRKKIWISLGVILGTLLTIYLGIAYFFQSHFFFYTTINGNDFSAKSISDVEEFMTQQVDGYVLTLVGNDQTTETIAGNEIALKYKKGKGLLYALQGQNSFLWPKSFWEKQELEVEVGVEYDRQALEKKVSTLACVTNKDAKESVSAKPVFQGTQFEIQKEVYGNKVKKDVLLTKIEEHLNGFIDTLNMEESGCYTEPKYHADSKEVLAARDHMNQYLKASITYDFAPHTEVVDHTVISQWLTVDKNMKVVFQKEEVKKYIKGLADKYDTSGKPRSFVTANGNTVEVRNGVYGWKINQKKEYEKLVKDIEAGNTVKREPVYSRRAKSHEGNDFGNTYVEIDLSRQHLWFIKDGQKIMESDVVTGNPNKGNATPQGVYTLTYKTKNAVLRGPKLPDGSYKWESPVSYWMPFNGGIGMHDANWQSSFGGTRYQTHGSHGCVNMPHGKAAEIYNYVSTGTPVICHY